MGLEQRAGLPDGGRGAAEGDAEGGPGERRSQSHGRQPPPPPSLPAAATPNGAFRQRNCSFDYDSIRNRAGLTGHCPRSQL